LSMTAALGTLISKSIFNRLRWSNAEQHASSKATTQETLVQWQHYLNNWNIKSDNVCVYCKIQCVCSGYFFVW
jgi:hypothetical protein